MKIEKASRSVEFYVHSLIASQMASRLAASEIDTKDPNAVAVFLYGCGFGTASIAALMDNAAVIAQAKKKAMNAAAAFWIGISCLFCIPASPIEAATITIVTKAFRDIIDDVYLRDNGIVFVKDDGSEILVNL